MAYTATGTVHIPTEEFWAWVTETKQEIAERDLIVDHKRVTLYPADGFLELITTQGETFEIDSVDFWTFVGDYHPDLGPAESRFGPPRFDDNQFDLVIPFCASTESINSFNHPDNDAIKAAWKRYGDGAPFYREA